MIGVLTELQRDIGYTRKLIDHQATARISSQVNAGTRIRIKLRNEILSMSNPKTIACNRKIDFPGLNVLNILFRETGI